MLQFKTFDDLSSDEFIKWRRDAINSGYITIGTPLDQLRRAYDMTTLHEAKINPNLTIEQANSLLAQQEYAQLRNQGEFGNSTESLAQMYTLNPEFASSLYKQLIDNGYKTISQIDELSKDKLTENESDSWLKRANSVLSYPFRTAKNVTKDYREEGEINNDVFNDFLREAKDTIRSTTVGRTLEKEYSEEFNKQAREIARRNYLEADNARIYSDIQKQIDDYQNNLVKEHSAEYFKSLMQEYKGEEGNKQFLEDFSMMMHPHEEEVTDENGITRTYNRRGSSHYIAFEGSDTFKKFGFEEQVQLMAEYQACQEIFGREKADEYLDNFMKDYIAEHQPYFEGVWYDPRTHRGKIPMTLEKISSTILNNTIYRPLSWGLAGATYLVDRVLVLGNRLTGGDWDNTYFGDVASVLTTGRTVAGLTPEEAQMNLFSYHPQDNPNEILPLSKLYQSVGNLYQLRGDYLANVDKYNTWNVSLQEWAKQNNGISGREEYVLPVGQNRPDFWSYGTISDVLGMTSQMASQVISMYLMGGGKAVPSLVSMSAEGGVSALMTKEAGAYLIQGMAEGMATTVPIAQSYAYNNYEQVYNGAMEQAMNNYRGDIDASFMNLQSSQEYKSDRFNSYQEWLQEDSSRQDTDKVRQAYFDYYDEQAYSDLFQDKWSQRQDEIKGMVQSAATDAYVTSFIGESLKYGMINAAIQPYKAIKAPEQVLATNLQLNTYGKLTQNELGRFTMGEVPLLGAKKWATLNPKILGTYNVAKNMIVSGGLSNYTDELTSAFAMGYGLSEFNSEYMRQYDPVSYAGTWHGGTPVGKFMEAVGEGIYNLTRATIAEQSLYAFYIGALGGAIAPRLVGRDTMRETYAKENAETFKETGKTPNWWKKFRQGFNTWATGGIGEYELTRQGIKEKGKQVQAYNETLDERDKLMLELSALQQNIIGAESANLAGDFAGSAAKHDELAMKLLYNERRLSSNPLHRISNQRAQNDLQQIRAIAKGQVSEEEKERLITEAISTDENIQARLGDQQLRQETWQNIKQSAKRMIDFVDDYNAAEAELLEQDRSFEKPENYRLLTQMAELKAKENRIKRDIQKISEESGITINTETRGNYGQKTESQKQSLIKGAQDTISKLEKQKEKSQAKIEELSEKIEQEKDEEKKKSYSEDLFKEQVTIKAANRHIAELNRSIEAIENNELLTADSGLSTDAVILHDMITNPEQYSKEQQEEIEKFKKNTLEVNGEVCVQELARLQDQLAENSLAQKSLKENPQDYIKFTTSLDSHRQEALHRAMNEQLRQSIFKELSEGDSQLIGIKAAMSLSEEDFDRFQQEYPEVAAQVKPYTSANKAVSPLKELIKADESKEWDIFNELGNLIYQDLDYVNQNGAQGIVDMLAFLQSQHSDNPVLSGIIEKLRSEYQKVQSIAQATTAYTERHEKLQRQREKEIFEQVKQNFEEYEKEWLKAAQATADAKTLKVDIVKATVKNTEAYERGLKSKSEKAKTLTDGVILRDTRNLVEKFRDDKLSDTDKGKLAALLIERDRREALAKQKEETTNKDKLPEQQKEQAKEQPKEAEENKEDKKESQSQIPTEIIFNKPYKVTVSNLFYDNQEVFMVINEIPIIKTKNGTYYELRTSKKTGKQWKKKLSSEEVKSGKRYEVEYKDSEGVTIEKEITSNPWYRVKEIRETPNSIQKSKEFEESSDLGYLEGSDKNLSIEDLQAMIDDLSNKESLTDSEKGRLDGLKRALDKKQKEGFTSKNSTNNRQQKAQEFPDIEEGLVYSVIFDNGKTGTITFTNVGESNGTPKYNVQFTYDDGSAQGGYTTKYPWNTVTSVLSSTERQKPESPKPSQQESTPSQETQEESIEPSSTEAAPESSPSEGATTQQSTNEMPKTEEAAKPETTNELPPGVTRNEEGKIVSMTIEEQVEQLGIESRPVLNMRDLESEDSINQDSQQEEVHGLMFNPYETRDLRNGTLIPQTGTPIHDWYKEEGINLGAIVDDELFYINQVNPKIQLMVVKNSGTDSRVSSNIFLVVEYTEEVSKYHLPTNGGVIPSGNKKYLIIGNMWNTEAQKGTPIANNMKVLGDTLVRTGQDFFTNNPSERFYVDPTMNTVITTFNSGHIINDVNGETQVKSVSELIDEYNSSHTEANQIGWENIGVGAITEKEGFVSVGPYNQGAIYAPIRQGIDKYGQVYIIVPAANGNPVPIFIQPRLMSDVEFTESNSELKTLIDQIIPRLLDSNFSEREAALVELSQLLCITGSMKDPDGVSIDIGTEDSPVVTLLNGKSVFGRPFNINKGDFSVQDLREAIYRLNPRINLNLLNLAQGNWLQRYDEAGALMTDSAKLGTYGSKFYVAPINIATGQPITDVQKARTPNNENSDYMRRQGTQGTPVMLHVGRNTYVQKDGKWVHQKDHSPVTDSDEKIQIEWAHKVATGEAELTTKIGSYNYYVLGAKSEKPKVVAFNISTGKYVGVTPQTATQMIERRKEQIRRQETDDAAREALRRKRELEEEQKKQEQKKIEQGEKEQNESAEYTQGYTEGKEAVLNMTDEDLQEAIEYQQSQDSQYSLGMLKALKEEQTRRSQKNIGKGIEDPIKRAIVTEPPATDVPSTKTSSQERKISIAEVVDNVNDIDLLKKRMNIYNIIRAKKKSTDEATREKWKDFDTSRLVEELERLGIATTDIDNLDKWLKELEDCL